MRSDVIDFFGHLRHRLVKAGLATALFLSITLASAPFSFATEDKEAPLVFGVVPQQSSAKLFRDWSPILKKLSEMSGVPIRFATAPTIPEFEARLAEGRYDIAYMNPYHYTVFNQSPGYQAIAHAANKRIKGILVAREGSAINKLEDLEGKSLSFPAPAAFAATLLTQATLKNRGINFTPVYVGSHDSSYLGVADGLYEAGGGIVRTLGAAPDKVKDNLKVLYMTDGYTPHAIATHPSVNDDQRRRLQNALATLAETEEGKSALKALNIKGFQRAEDKDWDDVRALNISVITP